MMKRGLAAFAIAVLGVVFSNADRGWASDGQFRSGVRQAAPLEFSAQARRASRARTRIKIYPYRYLPPYAKRDCISWLEPEWRPSGTVIVPRLRCWWMRG